MKKIVVIFVLLFAVSAFAQQTYNLSDLKRTKQGFVDAQGKPFSGTVKGHKLEYDIANGAITQMRMYDDNGFLIGQGMMNEGVFTGTNYHLRADGSVRFEIVMVNGETVESYCVQGSNKKLLSAAEIDTYEEPDCK